MTSSGSGLDPHISVANALGQAARVADARGLSAEQVRALVAEQTQAPWLGLMGAARVNVLLLNLALDAAARRRPLPSEGRPTSDERHRDPARARGAARGGGEGGPGRLKIFLGAAPGVGKTYAMLEAARRRAADGVDVVAAVVETHGRAETEALVRGLEVLPRRPHLYRGRILHEMDLDALLARRPQLALIDELAHTNVGEGRHEKRWQDVEEVLAAGIDVYTTLNVQHLETLNDTVARISGVRVRETLPDQVLELADEIELVDLPPEELIERLRAGKVYVPEQVARAIQNFFAKGNLTALREMAMRVAADRVDAQLVPHMRRNAIAGPWPTQRTHPRLHQRVAGREIAGPHGQAHGRPGARRLDRANVVSASDRDPERRRQGPPHRSAAARRESSGPRSPTLNAESDIAEEILAFARSRNVSRLLVGRPRRAAGSRG